MSVSAAGDPAVTEEGFGGQGSPSMPDLTGQPVPMDGADVATEEQFGDVSAPPDTAEGPLFSDEDLAFLQSEEVAQWFAKNKPPGFWTEEEFQQHKANLQRQLDTQWQARVDAVQRQAEEQAGIAEAQTRALVGMLYQAWQEQGLEPGTPEWQQREQQTAALAKAQVDQRKLQHYEGQRERNASIANHARAAYDELRAWGVNTENNAIAANAVRDYLVAIQRGQYQTPEEIAAARSALVRQVVKAQAQPQAQPPQQPQQPQAQPPAQTQQPAAPARPDFGPMRSVRGAVGASARSGDDVYAAGRERLIQQYGDETKVPLSEWNKLDIEASMAQYG